MTTHRDVSEMVETCSSHMKIMKELLPANAIHAELCICSNMKRSALKKWNQIAQPSILSMNDDEDALGEENESEIDAEEERINKRNKERALK